MTNYRAMLLSATATAALLGASQGASAFEVVDWDWTHTVAGHTNVNVDVVVWNDPTGLVQVEKLQMHFGNIDADAHVDGVYNRAVTGEGSLSEVVIEGRLGVSGDLASAPDNDPNYDHLFENASVDVSGVTVTGGTVLDATEGEIFGGTFEGEDDIWNVTADGFRVVISPDFVAAGALDAVDLPMVENAATAVVNNQSIEAGVPLYLHDAQFAAGGFGLGDPDVSGYEALGALLASAYILDNDEDLEDINEHTTIAGLMTVAAGVGLIQPASVTADASVSNILNAYVDNAATAVTNNASFTVEPLTTEDNVLIADLTQWGYAEVAANAYVGSVNINGYTNFADAGLGGAMDEITPIVSNAATAVGNNLSISVGNLGGDD